MPYRTQEPIRRYPLRSSRVMIAVTVVMVGLALAAFWSVSGSTLLFGGSRLPTLLLVGGLVLGAAAYLHSLKNEIVAGGRGEVVLYDRSLSVPRAVGGPPLSLSYADLALHVTRIESRTLGATVAVASRLTLSGGSVKRSLSSRLFTSDEAFHALVGDLEALRQGQPLPRRRTPCPTEEPDEMDDRLDEELAQLD